MELYKIAILPTCIEGLGGVKKHESLLKSFHILDKVLEMVDRGDSPATIHEIVEFLQK